MNKYLLLNYLNCRRLLLSQGEGVSGLYHTLYDVSPEYYVPLLAEVASDATRKREVLIHLLQSPAACGLGHRYVRSSFCRLPARKRWEAAALWSRHNQSSYACQRLRSSLDGYGLSPQMESIKKQYVMRLLKHALGEHIGFATDCSPALATPEARLPGSIRQRHEFFARYVAGRYRAGA
jgi:hypothetical protein